LGHADRVLRRDRGECRGAVDAEGGESLKIGLNARARSRVGAGNGESFADFFYFMDGDRSKATGLFRAMFQTLR
jgi:hypothetical protein